MKILCPVDSAAEAEVLSGLGAGELYGGYLPARWAERFALAAPPNRRTFAEAQIRDAGELRAVIAAAHTGGAEFFMTVNSPVYAREQYPALLALAEEALAAGTDAFIAADPGFIVAARARWPGVRIHLSTLADAANHGAAAFWRRLGVERITLPRHLTLAAMRTLLAASPDMRFDAFVLYGQCPNDEGQCTFSHDHPGRTWPCVQPYAVTLLPDSPQTRRAAAAQAGWAGLSRADACGLCALPDLARLGVEAAKIVGRGTPTARKAWAVSAIKKLLGLIADGTGRDELHAATRELSRGRFAHGCSPYLCYFPEFIPFRGQARETPLRPFSAEEDDGPPHHPRVSAEESENPLISLQRGEERGRRRGDLIMERAVFVPDLERLPPPDGSADRLYLGSEFCVWRLPGERDLREALAVASRRGLGFSLVTPFLDEAGLARTLGLVRALPEDPATEVVANDLGLIESLRQAGWRGTVVAGRLLTRQRRGPGFQSFGDVPPAAAAALRGSALDSPAFVELLGSAYGVQRFELDDLVQGFSVPALPAGVSLSLYQPYLLVSATRNCPWIFDGRTWDRGRGCARPCRGQALCLVPHAPPEAPGAGPARGCPGGTRCPAGRPLMLGGCAQFLEHRGDVSPPPGINRIVWQPEVPA